jgi:large subunit ribosomal protein L24e
MVEKRNCSFCGDAIEPGTGKMYVKKDGSVFNFCSNKCKKNNINLGRVSRRTRWTVRYGELKASTLNREKGTSEEPEEETPVEKPVKKPAAKPATKVAKKAESPDAETKPDKPAKKAPAKPKKESTPKDK